MARGDEITTKFKVDISDLKSGIAEANSQIKLANAEFKAATAGMDDWTKSAEGIKAKLNQLESVLSAQKTKLEAYNEQLNRQQKAYDENGKRAAELREQLENLAKNGVEKTSDEYKKYETALNACEAEQEKNKKSLDALKITVLDQQAAVNKTEAEIGKYSTALDGLEGESKDADKASEDLSDSVKEAGKSADDASGGFTVLKGALADLVADGIRNAISALKDFVKESIDVGKTFDASMSQVGAVSGATGEDLDALREKAKEMGANTKYSASEAADAFNYMAMAGWKTEDMLGGIEGILSLAAASGEDLARTSDIVTDALTAFGLSAEDSGHFADVLAAASSNANTNVSMMGETFKYVAPLAGSLGYSAEDVAAAVGLMANAGIKASQAGTSLRSAMTRLVKPTKDSQGALSKLGLIALAEDTGDFTYNLEALETEITKVDKATEAYNEAVEKYGEDSEQAQKKAEKLAEAENLLSIAKEQQKQAALQYNFALLDENGNIRQLSETLDILRGAFAEVDEAEKANIAAQLFGQEAMSGMLAIINASEEDYEKLSYAIENSSYKVKSFQEAASSAGIDVEKMNDALTAAGISTEDLEVALNNSNGSAEWFLETLDEWSSAGVFASEALNEVGISVEDLQTAIDNTTGAAGEMAAVMQDNLEGDLTKFNSKLEGVQISLYEKFEPAMREGVEALSGLLDMVVEVIDEGTRFVEWLNSGSAGAEALKTVVIALAAAFTGFMAVSGIISLIDGIKTAFVALNAVMAANPIGLVVAAIAALVAAILYLWNNCEEFRDFVTNLGAKIKEIVESTVKAVKEFFVKLWADIKEAFSKTGEFFKEKFEKARDAVKNAWKNAGQWFKERKEQIQNAFATVDKFMGDKFGGAWEAVKLYWKASVDWFKNIWELIKAVFAVVQKVLAGDFQGAWDEIKKIVDKWKDYFKGIWDGIKSIFKPVGDFFAETFNKAKDAVKAPINFIIRGLNTLIKGINKIGFDVPDWVPVIGGQKWGFNIPEIPELARGGVLRRGQLGLLEGSGAEAVVPLENNAGWIHNVAADLLRQIAAVNGGSVTNIGGAKDYNFTQIINAPEAPSRIEIYRQTRNLLAYAKAAGGV